MNESNQIGGPETAGPPAGAPPPTLPSFTISSELRITPEAFWRNMSMSAVNAELSPLARMTTPSADWKNVPLGQWPTGLVIFRSVILMFGFVPVDVHSLRLERIDPEGGFRERSHSWFNTLWEHHRWTTPTTAGCIVHDAVAVQGRVRVLTAILMPVYRLVFRHRHRRLVTIHGRADGD